MTGTYILKTNLVERSEEYRDESGFLTRPTPSNSAVATSGFENLRARAETITRGTKSPPSPSFLQLLMLPDPFTTEDGDVVLRVGPDHTFRVHKLVLSLVSPVFKDLFWNARPDQPDDVQEGSIPVVPIADPPESVDLLLRFIYPGAVPPTVTDPAVLSALLTIADKYGVQTISSIVKERLADEGVLEKDPFGVYIVARRWGFADEAKGAARRLTLTEIMKSPSSKDPMNLAGEDFFRLLWFMQKRGDEAKRVIRTDLVTWNDDVESETIACSKHSGTQAREFFDALAEVIVTRFDIDPRLDALKLVMALRSAPDPPDIGPCRDIDSSPEQEYFYVYCPLKLSSIVGSLSGLASQLETICEKYLSEALDGSFPD